MHRSAHLTVLNAREMFALKHQLIGVAVAEEEVAMVTRSHAAGNVGQRAAALNELQLLLDVTLLIAHT